MIVRWEATNVPAHIRAAAPVAESPEKKPNDAKLIYGVIYGGGLGDEIKSLFDKLGITRIQSFITRVTGQECNCEQRREKLNRLPGFRNLIDALRKSVS